jgi:hypothetical protein
MQKIPAGSAVFTVTISPTFNVRIMPPEAHEGPSNRGELKRDSSFYELSVKVHAKTTHPVPLHRLLNAL